MSSRRWFSPVVLAGKENVNFWFDLFVGYNVRLESSFHN